MKASCPKCGCRGHIGDFIFPGVADQVATWRRYIENRGLHMFPDGRVSTEVAAELIGLGSGRARTLRNSGQGPDYIKGPGRRVTYTLESLAEWYLAESEE